MGCSWNAHKIINTHSKKLWPGLTCSSETPLKSRAVAWFIDIVGNSYFFIPKPNGAFKCPESYILMYIETVSLEPSQETL